MNVERIISLIVAVVGMSGAVDHGETAGLVKLHCEAEGTNTKICSTFMQGLLSATNNWSNAMYHTLNNGAEQTQ